MRVALLQMDPVWHDKAASFAKVRAALAPLGPCDLLVLPEMFATGFTMRPGNLVEDADGETGAFLAGLAREAGCTVLGGLIERGEELPRNVLAAYDPSGACVGRYAKLHPFSFSGEHEKYAPGSETVVVPVGGLRVGLTICYDLRFPALYRSLLEKDVHAYAVIANWPRPRTAHWRALLVARAIENQAFVLGVNRVGEGGGLTYEGSSLVVGPQGDILADGGTAEGLVRATLDLDALHAWREAFPALRDRRAWTLGAG